MANLSKIAEGIGFSYEKPYAYGRQRGFDITIKAVPQEAKISFSFQVEAMGPETFTALVTYVNGLKKQWGIVNYVFDKHSVNVDLLNPYSTMNQTRLSGFVDLMLSEFEALSIFPNETCVLCGEKDNLTDMKYNGIRMRVHQECKETKNRELVESHENEPIQNPHAFNGIIGALIGAALGSIPWVIVEVVVGLFAAVLGILIGYSAFFFYKKFGGAVTTKTKYVILVATILGVFFTNFLIASYIIVNAGGALVIDNYLLVYSEPEIALALLQDLGLGLLISIFALPAVFRKVKSEEKSTIIIE